MCLLVFKSLRVNPIEVTGLVYFGLVYWVLELKKRAAPTFWQPRDVARQQMRLAALEQSSIAEFADSTLRIANEERFWEPKPEDGELRELFVGLRRATDVHIQKAYQILNNAATKRQRRLQVMRDLLQWARKKGRRGLGDPGGLGKPWCSPKPLRVKPIGIFGAICLRNSMRIYMVRMIRR